MDNLMDNLIDDPMNNPIDNDYINDSNVYNVSVSNNSASISFVLIFNKTTSKTMSKTISKNVSKTTSKNVSESTSKDISKTTSKNLQAITLDNAYSRKSLIDINEDLFHNYCFAHILNLIVKDGLKKILGITEKFISIANNYLLC
ncbi:11012_t:CDS:2 [Scutellospora calospora]|uniref:11012_t:CDS:1 n=1 Tax=Scutellospora calospora TaxID=85575 RepID=A0ACA9KIN3_9GLOM|nr:11012_t:CDS:2 [Scutellospora calospora]